MQRRRAEGVRGSGHDGGSASQGDGSCTMNMKGVRVGGGGYGCVIVRVGGSSGSLVPEMPGAMGRPLRVPCCSSSSEDRALHGVRPSGPGACNASANALGNALDTRIDAVEVHADALAVQADRQAELPAVGLPQRRPPQLAHPDEGAAHVEEPTVEVVERRPAHTRAAEGAAAAQAQPLQDAPLVVDVAAGAGESDHCIVRRRALHAPQVRDLRKVGLVELAEADRARQLLLRLLLSAYAATARWRQEPSQPAVDRPPDLIPRAGDRIAVELDVEGRHGGHPANEPLLVVPVLALHALADLPLHSTSARGAGRRTGRARLAEGSSLLEGARLRPTIRQIQQGI
mmetsp:Transcript_29595/g.79939  ORF Transcript_29595/g.79939 Transcript_29595/m.79939 type:complete len:343 (-) Transcript_29595:106-1134(-)